ncbi:MAG: twin-arginine translocase subunit TatC [Planctomycetota bacterium]|nr:twin-arginine translocase subunit TatC [Planctomycetota bacterium]
MAEKDLFDDSTMTFGEHLEALRSHLWKAIIGWLIATVAAFWLSKPVIIEIQRPVIGAMETVFMQTGKKMEVVDPNIVQEVGNVGVIDKIKSWLSGEKPAEASQPTPPPVDPNMQLEFDALEVLRSLHKSDPERYDPVPDDAPPALVKISLVDTEFGKLISGIRYDSLRPRTDGVDEAFMIYLKVSLVVGFVLASPWIFFQLWCFVAAGLYPAERKYVYRFMPLSIGLFLVGGAFCFYVVIPYVLKFLFQFNVELQMRPEIKIGTWIMFALVVTLMFGLSFQLPLVMLVLDKIGLVPARLFREQRRWAILIIAFLSMVLTPADPVSMMAMMIPLLILYEFGILMCGRGSGKTSPFEIQSA